MFYRKSPRQQEADNNQTLDETEVRYGKNPTCFEVHEKWHLSCDQDKCRNWIDFSDDLNCAVVCARKHEGGLSLREVAERMRVSFPRVSQIEHAAFRKLGLEPELEEFEDFQSE